MRISQSTECFISLHELNVNSFYPPGLDFGEYISCRNGMVSALAIIVVHGFREDYVISAQPLYSLC